MKRWLRILVFYLFFAAALGLDHALGNDRRVLAMADPISGTILLTIAVSAALAGGQYILTRALAGRPKPIQRGKLDGGLQLQDSDYDLFINEIYGGDPGDGLGGGIKAAGIIIDASPIRPVVTTTHESTGGGKGGGGGGGGGGTVETTSYYMDLDVMVGRGVLNYKKIWFVTGTGMKLVYDMTTNFVETGVIDPDFPPEDEQHYYLLPDPLLEDPNPKLRYGHVPVPDEHGTIDAEIVGSGYGGIRIYEGNDTQLPDPLFEGINNAKYGAPAGAVAYRHRSHVVFENVDVSNGVPNILFLAENKELKTLDLILADRAERVGVLPEDLNFAELDVNVRGWIVTQEQAPRSDMEELSEIFDVNFFEDIDGTITGEEQDYTVVATIDEDDIGARAQGDEDNGGAPPDLVNIRQGEQTALPTQHIFGFYDPVKNYDPNSATGYRQVTNSEKRETVRHSVVMTVAEGQIAANRDIAKAWSEADAFTFDLFPKYAYLRPGQRVLVPKDGEQYLVKLTETSGSLPGPRHFAGVSQKAVQVSAAATIGAAATPKPANVPANTVATFIDNPRLLSQQNAPGFLVAGTPKDVNSGEWKTATVWVDKGDGFKRLAVLDAPATMGRAVGALPDVPIGLKGEWDDVSEGTLDLFYGELASGTDDNPIPMYWGDEVIEYVNAVKDNSGDYPNRWTISRLHRRLKGTDAASATHQDMERAVLLDDAVKFIKVDQSERDVERTYKVTTNGLFVAQAVADAAPIIFTWTGQTLPSFTVAGPNLHVPTIGAAPTITKDDASANWIVNAPKPSYFGLPITGHEIRLYSDSACTTLVRTIVGNLEGRTYVPQTSADGYFKYRWRNDSLEDLGDGAGWSVFSAASTVAYGTSALAPNTLDSGLSGYDPDPYDSGNPHKRIYTDVY